jgi:hypothetical protein
LHEPPDVPQFDLPRYMPPRGVPERIQALANPENIERINDAARRGVDMGAREFFNTEQLRERFIAELGAIRGQAAYEKYLNLIGATSPISTVGTNIRNASYHYMRSGQGLPPVKPYWDGSKWALTEPLPFPYGHLAQGLHAKKVNEVLQQGSLAPLTNPKTASFPQNLRGNHMPVMLDMHGTRFWGVVDASGRPLKVMPRVGYGFIEGLHQAQAPKLGLTPAQHQTATWFGAADQTGVRSRLIPWLGSFEERVALTAKRFGLTQEEVLRRLIRHELSLISLGGVMGAGTAIPATLGEMDE